MKTKFKNFSKQLEYVSKIIERDTTLDRKCQYCGQKAEFRYEKGKPYKIQIICRKCKVDKNLLIKQNRGFAKDIPILDIRDYYTDKMKIKEDKKSLSKFSLGKMKELSTTNLTMRYALKSAGLSIGSYRKFMNILKIKNPDLYNKIKDNFNKNRINRIKQTKMSYFKDKSLHPNNLYKIKMEKNLSNREIIKMSDGKFTLSHLSIIASGKSTPKIKTKCMLAEVLGVSVADIFPEDELFYDVFNYNDYLRKMVEFNLNFNNYLFKRKCSVNKSLIEISNKTGISVNRLYNLASAKCFPKQEDIIILNNLMIKNF